MKKPIIMGFVVGVISTIERVEIVYGKTQAWKDRDTGAVDKPGILAENPFTYNFNTLIKDMDAYYQLPKNKDTEMADALWAVVYGERVKIKPKVK